MQLGFLLTGRAKESVSACLAADIVSSFVEGALSFDDDQSVREHIDVCPTCRRRVAQVGAGASADAPHAHAGEIAPPTRNAERDDDVGPGSLIGGKYRVVREIGTGGMGKVFAASHIELGQTVAIKVMHLEMARDVDAVRRFVREGRAAALLRSDHAVRINDVGRLLSGVPYLVMEYLEGEDLDRLRIRHGIAIDDVVDYTLQALAAVTEAHDAGIVHRDIKPQNLFLARLPDGELRVKVLDFGLAKELSALKGGQSALTTDNMILGSPHFMSPEQIRSPTTVDGRTDIWALGATMFLLLTGRPPYTSNTVHGLLARILADPAPRPSEVRADVPKALDDIVHRCMARDVFARFQTAGELAAALRALSGREGSLGALRRSSAARVRTDDMPRTAQDRADDLDDNATTEEQLMSTRVRPALSPDGAVGTPRMPERGHQPALATMAAAGVHKATVPFPVVEQAAPATVVAAGVLPRTGPMLVQPNPPMRVDGPAAVTRTNLPTLASAPLRPSSHPPLHPYGASILPAPPGADASSASNPSTSQATHLPTPLSSARRVWTAMFVVVSLAAIVVVLLGIRATRAHDGSFGARQQPTIRALEPASPASATGPSDRALPAASTLAPVSEPVPGEVSPSVSPSASAGRANAPITASGAGQPSKRPVKPSTSAAPPASAEKDPYSWGK